MRLSLSFNRLNQSASCVREVTISPLPIAARSAPEFPRGQAIRVFARNYALAQYVYPWGFKDPSWCFHKRSLFSSGDVGSASAETLRGYIDVMSSSAAGNRLD